eukprot:106912_1
MSFVWHIPTIPQKKQQLLCHGYIRNSFKQITTDIIQLCMAFYSPTFYTLHDIKNGKNLSKCISPLFSANQFKCYLELWPNIDGCNDKNIGQVRLVLCFIGFPPNIVQISTKFTLSIKETNTQCTIPQKTFTKIGMYCSWKPDILPYEKLKDIEQLTVACDIHRLIFFEQHKFRTATRHVPTKINFNVLSNLPKQCYSWNIEDHSTVTAIHNAPNVYDTVSPIFELFGFKWYLTFCPNGSRITRKGEANVFLHLASALEPDTKVWVKQRLLFCHNVDESILEHSIASKGQGMTHSVKTKDLLKMKRFRFAVEITLIDVLNKKEIITEQFADITSKNVVLKDDMKLCKFEWMVETENVKTVNNHDGILRSDMFQMFGFEWCLGMDSVGKLFLILLTKKLKTVDVLSVRCFIVIPELQVRYTFKGTFHKDISSVNWGNERISIDAFVAFPNCHVILEMELVDEYSKNIKYKLFR